MGYEGGRRRKMVCVSSVYLLGPFPGLNEREAVAADDVWVVDVRLRRQVFVVVRTCRLFIGKRMSASCGRARRCEVFFRSQKIVAGGPRAE